MNLNELKEKIKDIDIGITGDLYEQNYLNFIKNNVPYYEEFWKLFVFPYRENEKIILNNNLPRDHETVCIYNYSIFRSALRIYQTSKNIQIEFELTNDISTNQFDDCILWLDIGYNQLHLFALAVLGTFWANEKLKNIDINRLSEIEKNNNVEDYYIELGKILNNSKFLKDIKKERENIASIRNYIIHGPKFPGYQNYIPKPKFINELIQWSDFNNYIKENNGAGEKLTQRNHLVKNSVKSFLENINEFWKNITIALLDFYKNKEIINSELIQDILISKDAKDIFKYFIAENSKLLYGSISGYTNTITVSGIPDVSSSFGSRERGPVEPD